MDLEYITPKVESILENIGLGTIGRQLDQNFCYVDNGSLKKVEKKIKSKSPPKTPDASTKVKARNF